MYWPNDDTKTHEPTGRWVKKIPPPHMCELPEITEPPEFDYNSIWQCNCGLEWVWSNGGGWISPEELQRRRAQNDAEGIPNEPTNPHAHPFFRLPPLRNR